MMKYRNAHIQVLDVPGLIEGAEEGKGRGREVLSVVRGADLLVLLTEPAKLGAFNGIIAALERNGIRVNKRPPDITIIKKLSGGIVVHSNIKQDLDNDTIKEVAGQFSFKNAEITIREKLTMESLIDAFAKNRVYIPAIQVVNKADEITDKAKYKDYLLISARSADGLETLRKAVWNELGFATIYLVKLGQEPSNENPMVVPGSMTLLAILEKLGEEMAATKSKAKIWGPGARYAGQEVSLGKEIVDGMMIRFV
jgi:hypothetical protein